MEEQHQPEEQNLQHNTDEIEELQKLEEDVKLMAQKIAEFRQTLPDQLKDTLASIISTQRPANLTRIVHDSDPGPPGNPNSDASTPPLVPEGRDKLSVEKDTKHDERVGTIKQKISDNTSAMPLLVKRMKDCISRIDKLDSLKQDVIHPAFTRKRTS